MGVTGVMVDRGRKHWIDKSGSRVDGETPENPMEGEWFKCRLSPPTVSEKRDDAAFEYQRDMTLLVAPNDLAGAQNSFLPSDRIEVVSDVYGSQTYEVIGEVVPIRSKRKLVLFTLALRKYGHA